MPKTVLITAGPTREKIDPVRFISNRSTGVLGYELARAAKKKGYRVVLILGPASLPKIAGVKTVFIETARELDKAIRAHLPRADYFFMTSAVCDFHLKKTFSSKLKRRKSLSLKLQKNKDILAGLTRFPERKKKVFVGFCLETGSLIKNARAKLEKKKLDFIVGATTSKLKQPFGKNTFSPTVFEKNGTRWKFLDIPKKSFAEKLLSIVEKNSFAKKLKTK